MCNRSTGHCALPITMMAILRSAKFCWYRMFLSVVNSRSNPFASAASSNSPFVNRS